MLRQLSEVEGDQVLPPAGAVAKVKEKIAMFKLTTGAMMKVSRTCCHDIYQYIDTSTHDIS